MLCIWDVPGHGHGHDHGHGHRYGHGQFIWMEQIGDSPDSNSWWEGRVPCVVQWRIPAPCTSGSAGALSFENRAAATNMSSMVLDTQAVHDYDQ
jgi:hypothetical protein